MDSMENLLVIGRPETIIRPEPANACRCIGDTLFPAIRIMGYGLWGLYLGALAMSSGWDELSRVYSGIPRSSTAAPPQTRMAHLWTTFKSLFSAVKPAWSKSESRSFLYGNTIYFLSDDKLTAYGAL